MIAKLIIKQLRKRGWKFAGPLPSSHRKAVIAYGPHSSWVDFYLGLWVFQVTGYVTHVVLKKDGWLFLKKWLLGQQPYLVYDPARHAECMEEWNALLADDSRPFSLCVPFRWLQVEEENKWVHDLASAHKTALVPVGLDRSNKRILIHSHFVASANQKTEWGFVRNFISRFPVKSARFKIKRRA